MMYLVLPNSFRLARYLAPVTLIAFVPLTRPSADDSFPPPDAKGEWRTLSDPAKIAKTAFVDKQKLDEAFEYVQVGHPQALAGQHRPLIIWIIGHEIALI